MYQFANHLRFSHQYNFVISFSNETVRQQAIPLFEDSILTSVSNSAETNGLLKHRSTSVKRAMQCNIVEVRTPDLFQTKLMNVQMSLDIRSQGELL